MTIVMEMTAERTERFINLQRFVRLTLLYLLIIRCRLSHDRRTLAQQSHTFDDNHVAYLQTVLYDIPVRR